MTFPGSDTNKIEFFAHGLFEGDPSKRYSKEQIQRDAEGFNFSDEIQELFDELPDEQFDEQRLIDALNVVIQKRGVADKLGGPLEKREQIPPEWEEAYRGQYQPH